MDSSINTPVMHWAMYGGGAVIEFSGLRRDDGYAVSLEREATTVMSAVAPDAASLFRASSRLRERLQQLGYSSTPPEPNDATLNAGPCWGPAAPLQAVLLESLRSS